MKNIERSPDFEKALALMHAPGVNVFITGRAGTGKSTLLKVFRGESDKIPVVLAPTGVAAVNVGGQTIHSFFRFPPHITPDAVEPDERVAEVLEGVKTIVIDEISMVRADLLDAVDASLRANADSRRPFGGKKMVFIGDLYQLPPVVTRDEKGYLADHYDTPYFFSSRAYSGGNFETFELSKIYRQSDPVFIGILNAVRNNTITPAQLDMLNTRVVEDFNPDDAEFTITLTPYNEKAAEINARELERLKGRKREYSASLDGSFEKNSYPTDTELVLKKGAQVMLLNNDSRGRWVNGTIGRVLELSGDGETVKVQLEDGERVTVEPFEWDVYRYAYDPATRTLTADVAGSFVQLPLRLAWAVTIHKSQGKTFTRAVIDMGRGAFTPGQVYVALSRCTSLEGLVLTRPMTRKQIWSDYAVVKFMARLQYTAAGGSLSAESRLEVLSAAARDGRTLSIVYLKNDDTKTSRRVKPTYVGEMSYMGKGFLGFKAFCMERGEERTFRVDRVIEIEDEKK